MTHSQRHLQHIVTPQWHAAHIGWCIDTSGGAIAQLASAIPVKVCVVSMFNIIYMQRQNSAHQPQHFMLHSTNRAHV